MATMRLLWCTGRSTIRRFAFPSQVPRVALLSRREFYFAEDRLQLTPKQSFVAVRSFSEQAVATTAAQTTTSSQTTTDSNKDSKQKKKKEDDSNLFLDNLGKIFLGSIALLIGSLVRSSYGGGNRIKMREQLEHEAALDPLEMDDLRVANSELTPDVFRLIMQDVNVAFPQEDDAVAATASYRDFCHVVRKTMIRLKGDAYTVELGHLLDRAVLEALHQQGKHEDDPVPITFLFASLSLALHSSVDDRIHMLYEVLKNDHEVVTYRDVRTMIGYLQDTSQLVPEAQVVEAATKYPTQQYERGTPQQLINWGGSDQDVMDVDAFAAIVRSKSVCAWGECFNRSKSS